MKNILFFLLFSTSTIASEQVPKLKGTIEISVESGTIEADFQLENIPRINDYLIFLNSGLNIQYFRNNKGGFNYAYRKTYNTDFSYESFGYFLPDNTGKSKFLPPVIQFKYTGRFPVISNMDEASDVGDWKGNIAFNGKNVRADGLQAAWYPVLYDIEKDKRYEALSYDIEVICQDCKSIHINGSKPISATQGKFKRDKPAELTLFAGDYDIGEYGGSYYLNSRLSKEQMKDLGELTSSFIKYYEENLSIPYGENVVYIHSTPISKKNSWFFVSYPSIINIGHDKAGLSELFDKESRPFIAHELAHYYFGTYRKFNSVLGDMFSESFSEYLSLKLTKELIDEKTYQQNIDRKLNKLKEKEFVAIRNIKSNSDYGNRNQYVYTYAPVIWLAMEQELGEDKMWHWINKMLTTETIKTDYEFMIKTLNQVLNDKTKLSNIIDNYLSNTDAIKNASHVLNISSKGPISP